MELLHTLVQTFLHIDTKLHDVVVQYGVWTYGILFAVIFCETGLVVTPFLPGDSLLFAAGAFAASGSFQIGLLFGLLWAAAVLGDNLNYWIGRGVGPAVFRSENSRWLNKQHLARTHGFYERYGGKTLVLARFMPIIRTFAPFVAGVGKMPYWRFLGFSLAGGGAWMAVFLFAGYFFGTIPLVQHNFTLVIMGVIVVSVLPAVVEALRARSAGRKPEPNGV